MQKVYAAVDAAVFGTLESCHMEPDNQKWTIEFCQMRQVAVVQSNDLFLKRPSVRMQKQMYSLLQEVDRVQKRETDALEDVDERKRKSSTAEDVEEEHNKKQKRCVNFSIVVVTVLFHYFFSN